MNGFKLMQITTPNNQTTLDEILAVFPNVPIYGLDDNEMICVLNPDGTVYITFELVDGTPNVYQVYSMDYDNVKFAEVAHLWGDTITKIQGGNN